MRHLFNTLKGEIIKKAELCESNHPFGCMKGVLSVIKFATCKKDVYDVTDSLVFVLFKSPSKFSTMKVKELVANSAAITTVAVEPTALVVACCCCCCCE